MPLIQHHIESLVAAGIDEIRIAPVARSAAWLGTEYTNQLSPRDFYEFRDEELESRI